MVPMDEVNRKENLVYFFPGHGPPLIEQQFWKITEDKKMLQKKITGVLVAIMMSAILFTSSAMVLATGNDDHGGGGGGGGQGKGGRLKAKGSITAVDLGTASVTISDKRTGQLVTVITDSNTRIRKDSNKNATLADLLVGDRADARYDANFLASEISAKSAKIEGTLTAVDLGASTITITPLGGGPVVLNVTSATKIQRNELHVPLSALKVGDAAEARFDATTMNASKVETSGL